MYTVLVPVDSSNARATAQAQAAANLPDAAESVEVQLLHVFGDPDTVATTDPTDVDSVGRAFDRLAEAGVTTERLSRHGDPSTEILAAADDIDADMILLGGRKRSPLGSALFGSVSQQVTLDAERPVVVTGDAVERESPSHRCQSCGEEYFTDPRRNVRSCRNCGGTKVERVGEEEPPAA